MQAHQISHGKYASITIKMISIRHFSFFFVIFLVFIAIAFSNREYSPFPQGDLQAPPLWLSRAFNYVMKFASSVKTNTIPAHMQFLEIATGPFRAQMVYTAVKLGIPEAVPLDEQVPTTIFAIRSEITGYKCSRPFSEMSSSK